MNKFSKNALIAAIAVSASTLSNAGLYLSPSDSAPVLRHITEKTQKTDAPKTEHVSAVEVESQAGGAFGQDIPVKIALESIGIDPSFTVKVDEYVDNETVSWNSGIEWRDILNDISSDNNVVIVVNEEEKIVAVGQNKSAAMALSNVDKNSWPLIEGRSLRRNINLWAEKAGWSVAWDSRYDFPIEHGSVIKGSITEAMGVVFEAISSNGQPLSATFHKGNKVIQITDGGYQAGE